MNHLGEFDTMDQAYYFLVEEVKSRGFKCSPRGAACTELRPASFTILDPSAGLYTGKHRNLNKRFLALETVAYVGNPDKDRHAQLLVRANKNMRQFVDKKKKALPGAYGPRIAHQLAQVVEQIESDPWTRRAVAAVWSTSEKRNGIDVPCTLSLHFYLDAQRRLCCTATMRSNDLNWGTPYDVAAFTAIQYGIASCLGLEPGPYTHQVGSLHVYEETPPNVKPPALEVFEGQDLWPPWREPQEWSKVMDQSATFFNRCWEHAVKEDKSFGVMRSLPDYSPAEDRLAAIVRGNGVQS